MSKSRGNTGLITPRKDYRKNPIPSRVCAQKPEEILPGEGKIFTLPAPPLERGLTAAIFRQGFN
jgi:hypothetical protein